MAELVDAHDSGSCEGNLVEVRVFSSAPIILITWKISKQLRNETDIDFWIGKRSQVGKKVPKRFNKNLKFFDY